MTDSYSVNLTPRWVTQCSQFFNQASLEDKPGNCSVWKACLLASEQLNLIAKDLQKTIPFPEIKKISFIPVALGGAALIHRNQEAFINFIKSSNLQKPDSLHFILKEFLLFLEQPSTRKDS